MVFKKSAQHLHLHVVHYGAYLPQDSVLYAATILGEYTLDILHYKVLGAQSLNDLQVMVEQIITLVQFLSTASKTE